jgi:hypothetical protein
VTDEARHAKGCRKQPSQAALEVMELPIEAVDDGLKDAVDKAGPKVWEVQLCVRTGRPERLPPRQAIPRKGTANAEIKAACRCYSPTPAQQVSDGRFLEWLQCSSSSQPPAF